MINNVMRNIKKLDETKNKCKVAITLAKRCVWNVF